MFLSRSERVLPRPRTDAFPGRKNAPLESAIGFPEDPQPEPSQDCPYFIAVSLHCSLQLFSVVLCSFSSLFLLLLFILFAAFLHCFLPLLSIGQALANSLVSTTPFPARVNTLSSLLMASLLEALIFNLEVSEPYLPFFYARFGSFLSIDALVLGLQSNAYLSVKACPDWIPFF
jgi:hypothetical protein